jgi:hypothetical protein
MFFSGSFIAYVSFYGAHVVGWTIYRFINLIMGIYFIFSGYMKLRNPRIIIVDGVINFVTSKGRTWKSYRFSPDKIIVKKNAVYLMEDELPLQGKKLFSLWWTDTNQAKLKKFFENLSIPE